MKLIWTSELSDLTPGAEFLILHKVRVLGGELGTRYYCHFCQWWCTTVSGHYRILIFLPPEKRQPDSS